MKSIRALLFIYLLSAALVNSSGEEAGSPARRNAPALAVIEPLAMAMQVAEQLGRCVTNKELASIHNEDLFLSAALSVLRTNAAIGVRPESFKAELVEFGVSVSRLHSAAD